MRKLLNVLYVTTPDSYLARDGQNVLVLVDNETKFRVPVHNLEGIVHFGYTGASPALMALCAENNVALNFCTEHGRFLARVSGRVNGNVLVRRKQYRMADDLKESAYIARSVIVGKLANSRTVLQRALRDHPEKLKDAGIEYAIKQLARIVKEAIAATSLDVLRGAEGEGARLYFDCLDHLILDNKKTFYMRKRSRRPPRDPFNALLSFLYTMLANDVAAALETVGLDPAVGFLHRDRPGRASLALDIMEELRPYLADRLALSLNTEGRLCPKALQHVNQAQSIWMMRLDGLYCKHGRNGNATSSPIHIWRRRLRWDYCPMRRRCCWQDTYVAISMDIPRSSPGRRDAK